MDTGSHAHTHSIATLIKSMGYVVVMVIAMAAKTC